MIKTMLRFKKLNDNYEDRISSFVKEMAQKPVKMNNERLIDPSHRDYKFKRNRSIAINEELLQKSKIREIEQRAEAVKSLKTKLNTLTINDRYNTEKPLSPKAVGFGGKIYLNTSEDTSDRNHYDQMEMGL